MISRSVSEATPSQARLPEQYVLSRGGVEVNPKQLLNAVIALGGFDAMDEPKWRQVEQRLQEQHRRHVVGGLDLLFHTDRAASVCSHPRQGDGWPPCRH